MSTKLIDQKNKMQSSITRNQANEPIDEIINQRKQMKNQYVFSFSRIELE